jgi:Spy/CpxP family protein refolding chaperone
MKKFIFVAIFALVSLFVTDVVAQNAESKKAVMEQIMNSRLQMLKSELKLTDAQYAAFEPLYREYRKSLGRVADSKLSRTKPNELTNENALQVVSARLANTINTASVKQRYLLAFAEVIEPLQVEQLYRIDERISKEARKMIRNKK